MTNTAVILAGGLGTRLRQVVKDIPKPMAPVNGKPFLEYIFRYIMHFGVRNCVLSTGHLSEKISDHYGNNFGELNISYVRESSPLGTGGGIRLALENCMAESPLVLNGDSFFNIDLKKFYELHVKGGSEFSLALRRVESAGRYGTVVTDVQNCVVSFTEKGEGEGTGTINGGVYVLNRGLYLKFTPADQAFSIERDFFEKKLSDLRIMGFEFEGEFIDIGIPDDYQKAQNEFKGFKY